MSFEPRLRSCTLSECQKLKSILRPLLYQQGIHLTPAFNIEHLLPATSASYPKSVDQMKSAFAVIKENSSLRYDCLKDGCYARRRCEFLKLYSKATPSPNAKDP